MARFDSDIALNPGTKLRELRCLLVLAEELHFGRAAARLAMTQPPLSELIRKLEAKIGARLFERTTRAVRLTPASVRSRPNGSPMTDSV